MNEQAARKALELYSALKDIDSSITSLTANDRPLQKVTFYSWTSFVSGPKEYVPQHNAAAIVACILADMRLVLHVLVDEIKALGFEA